MLRSTNVWRLTAAVVALALVAGAQVQEPGLLGHWTFDDGAGDVASDRSGQGNHGEIYGGDWVKGAFGTALRLNGGGAHVVVPELSSLDGSDSLTVEAWVYWEDTGRYPNILTFGRWCPGGVLMFVSDGTCSFRMGRPGDRRMAPGRGWQEVSASLLSSLELRRWYHLAATFERPQIRTYVDGKPVGQATWDYSVGHKGDMLIGKWVGDVGHQGLIDEVKVYSRALSPAQVKASYEAASSGRAAATGSPYEVQVEQPGERPPAWTVENELARLEFDARLRITRLIDKTTDTNLLARSSTWLSLRTQERNWRPSSFAVDGERLTVEFGAPERRATLLVRARPRYFIFEVESVDADAVRQLVFVNLLVTPSKYVHGMPGLAADDRVGVCLRCLNLSARPTIGGRPPALRAACVEEYGLSGAKAALVAAPMTVLLEVLKELAVREGVPVSKQGGPFGLDATLNRASYMFTSGLSVHNVDEWIEMAQTACIPFLHLSGWYTSQGHYEPRASYFPQGIASLKAVIDKIHAAGLLAGMHTLTGCIQPHDPFIRPTPDPRLSKDLVFTLSEDVSELSPAITVVEDPTGLDVVWNYSSRGNVVQIGAELVQFRGLSTEPPYALTNCLRGAWGTAGQAHAKGAKAHHLFTRYSAFQPDEHSTLVDDVAECIAATVNECGFDLIYHDGAEGMPARQYGAAKMRTAIYERIKRPIRVESSWSGLHHCWWFHSCVGAWDHPLWGLKRCIDAHCESNVTYRKLSLLPAQLGWWAILGAKDIHDAEWPDEIEYLCAKALGHDMSMSFQTLTPASRPWNARQGEYLEMIGRYEKLRLSGYFSAAVRERLRVPREDFRLAQGPDGEWGFIPTDYLSRKVVASDETRRRWTVRNRFAAQPVKLRIQALYAAESYASERAVLLADFSAPDAFSRQRAARGVTCALTPSAEHVEVGKVSARYTATNTTAERRGAWACVSKTFSPDLNIGPCAALGVWVRGDGKGEVINFQLRSPALYHGAYDEHIVEIDFVGWRYFELLLRERSADEHYDHVWPYRSAMKVGRSPLDRRHVNELNIYYNNLPPGEQVECTISAIKALPVVKANWVNPRVVIGNARLDFPVTMSSGQYLEFLSAAECVLRDESGALLQSVSPTGEIPTLGAGDNTVEFGCDAEPSPTPRARVTAITEGRMLRGVAAGKQELSRALRRLDDVRLAFRSNGELEFVRQDRKTVLRTDGRDNVWSIVNDSAHDEPLVQLELRVGREIPGREYDEAATLDAFDDASVWQEPENTQLIVGPHRAGTARADVTATFEVSAQGARIGRACAVFAATSPLGDASGWAAAARRFDPPLDLAEAQALGLWVKGDGKDAFLKLQLRDAAGRSEDHYVSLGSSMWQYFELTQPAMGAADRRRIAGLTLYLLSVPARGSTTCRVDDLRALRAVPSRQVVRPTLAIGDVTLVFPTTLRAGDVLTLKAGGECRLVTRAGERSAVDVHGSLPALRSGSNPARFECAASPGNEVRVTLTRNSARLSTAE